MYPNYPPINEDNFKSHDWTDFSGHVQEAIPINTPAACVKEVLIWMMVDNDHVGDEADRCSWTGYLIYVQISLIGWLSKKIATVDKAIFGSKFVHDTWSLNIAWASL